MASTSSSSAASRPAWQQALLSIPEHKRCQSQTAMIKSILLLEECDPRIFSACNLSTAGDITSPILINSLPHIFSFLLINGSLENLKYYLSKEQAKSTLSDASFLYNLCHAIVLSLDTSSTNQPLEVLLSAIIVSQYHCMFSMVHKTNIPSRIHLYRQTANLCMDLGKQEQVIPTDTLGDVPFTKNQIDFSLYESSSSLSIALDFNANPTPRQSIGDTIGEIKFKLLLFLDPGCISPPTEFDYESLDFKVKWLAWQFQLMGSTDQDQSLHASDPLFQGWFELASLYLKFCREALKEAKEAVPADPFTVAKRYYTLLKAILNGVSKYNQCYSEVQEISQGLDLAVKACASWSPPLFIEDILVDLQPVFEHIIPCIQRVPSVLYRGISFFVGVPLVAETPLREKLKVNTDGSFTIEMKIPIEGAARKVEKACAACEEKPKNLLKCSGCGMTWYCSKDCQKAHWKVHKVLCKEMQAKK